MRWLPYPTRRSPHRRFIACLVACSYVLQPLAYAADVPYSPKFEIPIRTMEMPPVTEPKPAATPKPAAAAADAGEQPPEKLPESAVKESQRLCQGLNNAETLEKDFNRRGGDWIRYLETLEVPFQESGDDRLSKCTLSQHEFFSVKKDEALVLVIGNICKTQLGMEAAMNAGEAQKKAAENAAKAPACEGSVKSAQESYRSAHYLTSGFVRTVQEERERLDKNFQLYFRRSSGKVNTWLNDQKADRRLSPVVRRNFLYIWGISHDGKTQAKDKGLFTVLMTKIDQELEHARKRLDEINENQKTLAAIKCGSISGRDVPKNVLSGAGSGANDPSCQDNRRFTDPSCDTSGGKSKCETRRECLGATGSLNISGVAQEGGGGPPRSGSAVDDDSDPRAGRITRGPTTTSTDTNTSGNSSSWMPSGSTLLMVGGGVAAVAGGVILYKKNQDDKAKAKAHAEALESIALANVTEQQNQSATATSTSTSTSTSTDSNVGATPASQQATQGSTLSIEGVPAQAKVGSNIGTVTIKILGPNNVMTQNSDTDVTISCDSPSPCTLTGQLTVNTNLGKAEFSNVQFTGPHKNVRLKFSAPGFTPAVAAAEFDVVR